MQRAIATYEEKQKISEIIEEKFSKRGLPLGRGHERNWTVVDINKEDGFNLFMIHYKGQAPANVENLRYVRGLIVDLKNEQMLDFGYGASQPIIVDGPIEECEGEYTVTRKDEEKINIGNDVIFRMGMPGIAIRVYKLQGKVFFSTYKRFNGGCCSFVNSIETYSSTFQRLLGSTSIDDYLQSLFPADNNNPGYVHYFHIVSKDFLTSSPFSREDIYFLGTEVFSGNVTPVNPTETGLVRKKPNIPLETVNDIMRGTYANSEFGDSIVCDNESPTYNIDPVDDEKDSNDVKFKINCSSKYPVNGYIIAETVKEYTDDEGMVHEYIDRVYELTPTTYNDRITVGSSEGNLYASFIKFIYKVRTRTRDPVIDYFKRVNPDNYNLKDPVQLDTFALVTFVNSISLTKRDIASRYLQDFKDDQENVAAFILDMDKKLEKLRAKLGDKYYHVMADKTISGMERLLREAKRLVTNEVKETEFLALLKLFRTETPNSMYKLISSVKKYMKSIDE